MPFQNFPYTNFQNLNLDWILKTMKEAVEQVDGAYEAAEDALEAANSVQGIANQANATAAGASAAATNAVHTANAAETKADTAMSNAASAITTATGAVATANGASSQANSAYQNSVTAMSRASEAISRASSAENTAQQALDTVATKNTKIFMTGYGSSFADTQGNPLTRSQIISKITAGDNLYFVSSDTKEIWLLFSANTDVFSIFHISHDNNNADRLRIITIPTSGTITTNSYPFSGASGAGIFLIDAERVAGQNGVYYTFDKTPSQIYDAILAGMLPVVVYTDDTVPAQPIYKYYVMAFYQFDGEDAYVHFSRQDETVFETLRYIASEQKAYLISVDQKYAYVTPEMFGAVGDGVANDTAAVSAAMQNKRVILSKNYKITNTINALAEVVFGNGSAKISSTGGTALNFANNIHLSDFSVETPVQTDGIAIRAQKDIVAENLDIKGGRIGIQSDGSYFKNIFRSCKFRDFWGDSAGAVDVLYPGISEFSNNFVENVNNDLDRDADGVRFWQQDGINKPDVRILNNEFHNCRGRFIKTASNNTTVENNFCHNDANFTVIANFVGIDIQRGNSVVRFNHVMSPHALTFSVRENADTTHLCEENIFENVDCPGASASLRQVYVSDMSNGTGKTSVVIRHNKINNDIQMIQIPFLGSSVYKITDNEFAGYNYYPISTVGTFNANTRFDIHGNVDSEYAYDIAFAGGMPNVKGDRRVRCTDPVNFANISVEDVSFVANTAALPDYANTAFLSKMGDGNNSFVLLSGDAMLGGYMRNAAGTRIFFHKYTDSVVPNVTSADNGKTLSVVNGEYSLV